MSTATTRSKSKTARKSAATACVQPVRVVPAGTKVEVVKTGPDENFTLKIVDGPNKPLREVTIVKNRRIVSPELTARLERIGMIDSLDAIRKLDAARVKEMLIQESAKYADGDGFFAQLISGGEGGTLNTQSVWDLMGQKKIPIKDRLAFMSFGKKEVAKVLSGKEIDNCTDAPASPPQPRVQVDQVKDQPPVTLRKAIDKLSEQAVAGQFDDVQKLQDAFGEPPTVK